MCRFILYKGRQPIVVADLITRPAHSIITQSLESRLRLDAQPVNGDGFGLGWYEPKESQPCIFTSVLPAWSNQNLIRLAEKIRSPLLFAHVRATTGGTASSETNCHPWHYKNLMWMHNGHIAQFPKIKRKLQNLLSDELFLFVQGSTDSEWAFALFLSQLKSLDKDYYSPKELQIAMLDTIKVLKELSKDAGIEDFSLLNFAITDGKTVVCSRYNSMGGEAASLFYSSGTRFETDQPGMYKMVKSDKREDLVVIASEPTTFEYTDWLPIPNNYMIVVTPNLNVLLYPIDI